MTLERQIYDLEAKAADNELTASLTDNDSTRARCADRAERLKECARTLRLVDAENED